MSPRSRWEPVPAAYDVGTAIALFGANYDLRINGEVRRAALAPSTPRRAEPGVQGGDGEGRCHAHPDAADKFDPTKNQPLRKAILEARAALDDHARRAGGPQVAPCVHLHVVALGHLQEHDLVTKSGLLAEHCTSPVVGGAWDPVL